MGSMEEFIHYEKLIIFKRQLADPSITDERRRMLARLLALEEAKRFHEKDDGHATIDAASNRHRTKPRSNTSPYAGAVPISVIERDGMCSTIHVGGNSRGTGCDLVHILGPEKNDSLELMVQIKQRG